MGNTLILGMMTLTTIPVTSQRSVVLFIQWIPATNIPRSFCWWNHHSQICPMLFNIRKNKNTTSDKQPCSSCLWRTATFSTLSGLSAVRPRMFSTWKGNHFRWKVGDTIGIPNITQLNQGCHHHNGDFLPPKWAVLQVQWGLWTTLNHQDAWGAHLGKVSWQCKSMQLQ